DAMSSGGVARLSVSRNGSLRDATLEVPDSAQRVRLTEPSELFRGLGFDFWLPPAPAVLGSVVEGGPADRAGLKTGDHIIAIGGVAVKDFHDIINKIGAHPG